MEEALFMLGEGFFIIADCSFFKSEGVGSLSLENTVALASDSTRNRFFLLRRRGGGRIRRFVGFLLLLNSFSFWDDLVDDVGDE